MLQVLLCTRRITKKKHEKEEVSSGGTQPRWFQLFELRVIESDMSSAGRAVLLVSGRRGKKYGNHRYYGVKYEVTVPRLEQLNIWSIPVYVVQTPDKDEARQWYTRCLQDDTPTNGRG